MTDFLVTSEAELNTALSSWLDGDRIQVQGTVSCGGQTFQRNNATVFADPVGSGTLDVGIVSSAMDTLNVTGNNVTFEGLIVSSSAAGTAPPPNYEGGNDPSNMTTGRMVEVSGDDFTSQHCIYKDRARTLLRLTGVDAYLYHNFFEGGFYSVYIGGGGNNRPLIRHNVFHWGYEGIKLVGGGPESIPNSTPGKTPDVEYNQFYQFYRDGLDLTKGWRNLWAYRNTLYFASIDIKVVWDYEGEELFGHHQAWDMLFEENHHITSGRNCYISTMLQQTDPNWMDGSIITPSGENNSGAVSGLPDWYYYSPRGIDLKNETYELAPGGASQIEIIYYKAGAGFNMTGANFRNGIENTSIFEVHYDQRAFGDNTIDGQGPASLASYDLAANGLAPSETGSTYGLPATPGLSIPSYTQTDDPGPNITVPGGDVADSASVRITATQV